MITAIIETHDDEIRLAHALLALVPAAMAGVVREVAIIDHGSRDGTLAVADAAGCTIIDARAVAVDARHAAARAARGDWLMFLSPSSVLGPDWQDAAVRFIDGALVDGKGRPRAATFRRKRAGGGVRARVAGWSATVRVRLLAAPTREQGLIISRAFYLDLGGHRALAAMSDVDLARRVGRRRLTLLDASAVIREGDTRRLGFVAATRNAVCLALIALRVSGRVIGRLAP